MRQLIVEPEFRDKIPALSPEEFSKLEENILADGEVRDPLVVWNNTIIDGHNRWAIIQKHPELKWSVKQMGFPDKWAAIAWMCRNQLGRRNVTPTQRDYLLKEEYDALSKSIGAPAGNDNAKKQSDESHQIEPMRNKTRQEVAKSHNVSEWQVQKAVEFGRGLDAAEKVSPGIKDAVLSGEVKAPKKVIAEIRNLPEKKQKEAAEAIASGDLDSAKGIISGEHGAAILIQKASAKHKPEKLETDAVNKAAFDLYDKDRVVVHTVDDLLEDLISIVDDFKSKSKRSLVNYSTTLQTAGDRKKVYSVLDGAQKYILELKVMVS